MDGQVKKQGGAGKVPVKRNRSSDRVQLTPDAQIHCLSLLPSGGL